MSYRLALTLAVFGFSSIVAAAPDDDGPRRDATKALQAVVHINFADAERQEFGLKNIENILKNAETGAEIEVVCHGMGIGLLVSSKTKHGEAVKKLMDGGVRFVACENTMKKQSIKKDDLLHGTGTVPSGALEVVRKQREGYAYFKP